jgi:DEAD/DEAH box helicase domain-containing protein
VLAEEGFVHLADDRWNWTHESYPADAVSLRAVTSDNFVIVDMTDQSRVIGETDYTSALSTLHEKAIYILEGALYQVERLDVEGRKAYVRSVDCDYYTDAITYTKVNVLDVFESSLGEAADDGLVPNRSGRTHGDVHVVSRVVGFKKIRFYTNENVGSGDLDLPEQQMHTTSYWLTVPREVLLELPFSPDDRRDGISGLAHAMKSVAQLLLMCDQRDLGVSIDTGAGAGGSRDETAPITGEADAHVFLYDSYPGGIGFSAPLFRLHDDLLARTQELIASCPCETGCPSCVGPVGDTGPRAKTVALAVLERLRATSAPDEVPF